MLMGVGGLIIMGGMVMSEGMGGATGRPPINNGPDPGTIGAGNAVSDDSGSVAVNSGVKVFSKDGRGADGDGGGPDGDGGLMLIFNFCGAVSPSLPGGGEAGAEGAANGGRAIPDEGDTAGDEEATRSLTVGAGSPAAGCREETGAALGIGDLSPAAAAGKGTEEGL